jgi:uncharacterized Zn finger protein (UPF0148 family)
MNCKNCLAPLSNGDTYCKVCGKPVETNSTLPSNEEIIKNYNQPTQTSVPNEERLVGTQRPTISQPLEQTNVFKPITEEVRTQSVPTSQQRPVVQPSVSSVTPVTPSAEATSVGSSKPVPSVSPIPVRPEPAPIVNKGISKKVFAIGIIIAVIATALIVGLICIPIISSKVEIAKKEVEETTVTPQTITEERVLFGGYSFLIPDEYSYKVSGSQLIVEKTDTKEAMSIQVATDTYANLKANLTTLKTNLTTAKWTVGKIYMDQAVKNRVYLTVEATTNNKKVMIAYTKANATQVFGIVYLNPTSTDYPTETIETFNEIIDSAKENTTAPTTTITTYTTNKIFFATTTTKTTK